MNVCKSILGLRPYQGGKPIEELKRELGLETVIKLASNENPLGASAKVIEAIKESLGQIYRYPDGNGFTLKKALSTHLGVSIDTLTLGNGSNEVLELIARVFVSEASDEVVFSQYAFPVYPLATQALGATAKVTPAKNFGHDLEAMLLMVSGNTKLIFVANPNNPTGTLLSNDELYSFLERVPETIPVVLDQAYIEYLNADDDPTISWLDTFSNLIITRTFSKAYGLAGLRVGYAISSAEIADYINRVREPFNVNHVAQSAAIAALADVDYLQTSIKVNNAGVRQLEAGFAKLGLAFIASSANFVAVEVSNGNDTFEKLLREGVIVRPVEMPNYLRVSVGTEAENARLLEALEAVL
jgi:histidinol-phosphate aminotransferase